MMVKELAARVPRHGYITGLDNMFRTKRNTLERLHNESDRLNQRLEILCRERYGHEMYERIDLVRRNGRRGNYTGPPN
jgi:hypothetical protein